MNRTPEQRIALGLTPEPTNNNHFRTEQQYPLMIALMFLMIGALMGAALTVALVCLF
jgi:hypothetical protein